MRVGNIDATPIYDGHGVVAATEFFVNTSTEDWAPYAEHLDADQMWDFPLGGCLVRDGERVVLIDVGLGPHKRGYMQGGDFLQNLAAHGVQPQDVTDVVLTHLHADHFGWLSVQGNTIFANATVHCDAHDWDYFTTGAGVPVLDRPIEPLSPDDEDEGTWIDKLRSVEDRVQTWESTGPLLPNIDLVGADGHTPGSVLVVITSEDERATLVGDAMHSPVQFAEPHWRAVGDVSSEKATALRRQLSDEFVDSGHLIGGPHFPGLALGRVTELDGVRTWTTAS